MYSNVFFEHCQAADATANNSSKGGGSFDLCGGSESSAAEIVPEAREETVRVDFCLDLSCLAGVHTHQLPVYNK